MINIVDHIDHLVLTGRSIDAACSFYITVLGYKRMDLAGVQSH